MFGPQLPFLSFVMALFFLLIHNFYNYVMCTVIKDTILYKFCTFYNVLGLRMSSCSLLCQHARGRRCSLSIRRWRHCDNVNVTTLFLNRKLSLPVRLPF